MEQRFSNRQSLMDAATVLAARRAIDRELAHLIADPFDREAAKRLHEAVGANADRAQEALERLFQVTELREPWAAEAIGPAADPAHEDPAP
ncbi:hypothetical protein [Jiangella asiatica]|uniref:Uncharacterized protein n=1 Tax=Jiangella asiatica TaxID=2530372 RepID=A0A4R5DFN9_9ACTN|nr:hypothetical protein [Jiangella asiatica]TDE12589.1 hypothetical protein E1269_07035 [Jiangella asiatica]